MAMSGPDGDGVVLPEGPGGSPRPFDGWCFFHPEAVPERFRSRAVSVSLVPLLPGEARGVLDGRAVAPEVGPEDEAIVRLAAQGLTIHTIARTVGMSLRGVQYRLAGLRERFGVASTAELRVLLARRGL